MRKAALLLAVLLSTSAYAEEIKCQVVGVSDGDTLTCLTADKKQVKVRLAQIDAPEKAQPFGEKSKQALSLLAYGKSVILQPDTVDKYGGQGCGWRPGRESHPGEERHGVGLYPVCE